VGVELVAEVPDEARECESGSSLVSAQCARSDVVGKVGEPGDFVAARLALADAGADLSEAAEPDAAGNRLPARFVGTEAGQDGRKIHDAAVLIHYNDRARANVRPGPLEVFVVVDEAHGFRREDSTRRSTHQQRLEPVRGRQAARDVHDLTESHAEGDFGDAGS